MQKQDSFLYQVLVRLIVVAMTAGLGSVCIFTESAFAETNKTTIAGRYYEFDKDSKYVFEEAMVSTDVTEEKSYGTFFIDCNLVSIDAMNGVPAFEVQEGGLAFYYNYSDDKLNASVDEWHLVNDKGKKIDDLSLDDAIGKGTILIQTSMDQMNWVNVATYYDAFNTTPIRTDSIYAGTDVQLINGCYYRVLITYKMSVRTKEKSLGLINMDEYDTKKFSEVYEFYAYTKSDDARIVDLNQTYNLGSRVKVKDFDGYFGEEDITKDDFHYGWDIGNFYVSGYTDKVIDGDKVVFLKNVDDKVTLWFKLSQNINALNGDKDLSITADTAGYDQYFETEKTNLGRGALFIRYTDYNNNREEPVIYTNYLEANTSVDADTIVRVFEEGDYEVALDYAVTRDGIIDKTRHYRIFFTFSVRNGNCMVYPIDLKTGKELSNSSMTENGFKLDMAKSRYLKINIKREILKDTADGMVEDTRFNAPAKDGAKFDEEGIYFITVSNEYTKQFTTKKIYVGTNKIIRAHVRTELPIAEINNMLSEGCTITDDGEIILPEKTNSETTEASVSLSDESAGQISSVGVNATSSEATEINEKQEETIQNSWLIPVSVGVMACVLIVVLLVLKTKRQASKMAVKENKHPNVSVSQDEDITKSMSNGDIGNIEIQTSNSNADSAISDNIDVEKSDMNESDSKVADVNEMEENIEKGDNE